MYTALFTIPLLSKPSLACMAGHLTPETGHSPVEEDCPTEVAALASVWGRVCDNHEKVKANGPFSSEGQK